MYLFKIMPTNNLHDLKVKGHLNVCYLHRCILVSS